MKPNDIAALLDEPACSHNKKSKSGCAKAKPGATAGGCAFDGAQIALLPIADVAHIVHGSIACAGSSWDNRGTRSSGSRLFRIGMTTDMTEQDVIMGRGEKRLFHAIKQAIDSYHPAAVFVHNTCVPALIGDDIEAVCKVAAQRWETPVVPVDAAGFYGSKNLGNRIAGETMVKYVCGTREPDPLPESAGQHSFTVHDINLLGEYNIAGELWHVLPLMDELGLRVLCTLSGDARYREVQTMHRAGANMMVCSKAMINVARKLQDAYGTPWFEGSFYGITDVSQALRDFARLLDDVDLSQRTEALITREEAAIKKQLEPWKEKLQGKKVLLYTGGVKSWSVIAALQDLGMEVIATGTKKSTEDDKNRIRALMGEDALMLEDGNPRALINLVRENSVDILIAGGRNMYTALKARIPFLDINQEREFAYAGYTGMLQLARQMVLTIDSPIWPAVRKMPDWHSHAMPEPLSQNSRGVNNNRLQKQIIRPEIIKRNKALSVSPLKTSQSIGAALAFLGFNQTIPMLHGSQGCTAFGKVFFVRHFREPIPLQTTAMDQVSTVMGSEDSIIEGLKTLAEKNNPALIGVPTTGLAETQGSDVAMAIQKFRQQYPEYAAIKVVAVATPDYSGSLERGFARTVEALIDTLVPHYEDAKSKSSDNAKTAHKQLNILVGSLLTPGDLEELKEIIDAFGLYPLVLPDLSGSLDGHLDVSDYSALTNGGTDIEQLQTLGDSVATLVVGASLNKAADKLKQRTGVVDYRFEHLMGLEATDRLLQILHDISGQAVPAKLERQRAQLQDAMLDTHFMLGMSRIAIAAEPDLLVALSQMLAGVGSEVVAAVSPVNVPVLKQVMAKRIKIGDLEDLEQLARENKAEVLMTNSHGLESARRLNIPLLRTGFPQYDSLGGYQKNWIAYRGSKQLLFELANIMLSLEKGEIQPYQSIYSQKKDFKEHGL